jgi:hypothetical protein
MSDLRLKMSPRSPRNLLDGGWWPHSRDLASEFAELVAGFPEEHGRIIRAVYSPPDWDDAPRRVAVGGGAYVKVGKFPRDDTHVLYVSTTRHAIHCLLVVPPSFDESQGAEALLAAATTGNRHTGAELLDTVTNELRVDPGHIWRA